MDEDQLYAVSRPIPAQGDPLVRVLAAVIREGDRYLVCLRPGHKRHGGYWEFPGGKLEPGETLLEAAIREIKQELGVNVLFVGKTLFSCQDPGSQFLIEFVETRISGAPEALEHDEIRWVQACEMPGLKLAPSDQAFSLTIA
ncbi:MAG: (deoxy)nucleoside triphosphate pyrophosphohydrolase [bacterium]